MKKKVLSLLTLVLLVAVVISLAAPTKVGITQEGFLSFQSNVALAVGNPHQSIDIGAGAIDRASTQGGGYTDIDKENPADASGIIDTIEIWANTDLAGVKIGIFYTTNGDTLKCRDSETIGTVTSGSKQTFSELSLSVEVGDYLGIYWASGNMEYDTSGCDGVWYESGDHCVVNDEASYTSDAGAADSIYGIGPTVAPTVTTQAVTDITPTTATGHGTITSTGGENCSKRGIEPTATKVASSSIIAVRTGDGTILYNGYIYITGRTSPGEVAKVSTDYSSISVVEIKRGAVNSGYIDDIIEQGGYLWVADYVTSGGYLYKLDPSDLSVVDYWQIFSSVPHIYSLCTDGTYIYCGGRDGEVAKFRLSDNQVTTNTIDYTGYIHALCEDGDYLYGHTATGQKALKVQKSDLSLVASADTGATFCEDIVQDATYFYLIAELGTQKISRFAKADLDRTDCLLSECPKGDGLIEASGKLVGGIYDSQNDRYFLGIVTKSSFIEYNRIALLGLSNTEYLLNDLIVDGNYLHTLRFVGSNVYLDKFNLADILTDLTKSEETNSFSTGAFTRPLTGLTLGQHYYVRAYAYNSAGYGYGAQVEFTTAALIDIGEDAVNRASTLSGTWTTISTGNPANASGEITSVEIWANTTMSGVIVGTFYTTNGNTLKCRDSESIPGTITAGSKQTFNVTIAVETGDYIGAYWTGGKIDYDASGAGFWEVDGEYIDPNDEATYDFVADRTMSLYGTGAASYPDISNVPGEKDFGMVAESTNYWSNGSAPTFPLDDAECYFTVTNNGDTCSITIKATNFTGGDGWTLTSGSPGSATVRLRAGKSGDANEGAMVILTTDNQAFINVLAGDASKKWEIKIETGTFTDGAQKTSTITLTATLD